MVAVAVNLMVACSLVDKLKEEVVVVVVAVVVVWAVGAGRWVVGGWWVGGWW